MFFLNRIAFNMKHPYSANPWETFIFNILYRIHIVSPIQKRICGSPHLSQTFGHPCTELAAALNASAFGVGTELDAAITAAVEQVSRRYQLDLVIYRKEVI